MHKKRPKSKHTNQNFRHFCLTSSLVTFHCCYCVSSRPLLAAERRSRDPSLIDSMRAERASSTSRAATLPEQVRIKLTVVQWFRPTEPLSLSLSLSLRGCLSACLSVCMSYYLSVRFSVCSTIFVGRMYTFLSSDRITCIASAIVECGPIRSHCPFEWTPRRLNLHWRRLVKYIGGKTIYCGGMLSITDKYLGVSQLLGSTCPGCIPPKSTPM